MQDEQHWDTSFSNTTDEQWEQMSDTVRQEISKNKTIPPESNFPLLVMKSSVTQSCRKQLEQLPISVQE